MDISPKLTDEINLAPNIVNLFRFLLKEYNLHFFHLKPEAVNLDYQAQEAANLRNEVASVTTLTEKVVNQFLQYSSFLEQLSIITPVDYSVIDVFGAQ